MKIRLKNLILVFFLVLLFSFFLNFIFYKKYELQFDVFTDNLTTVENIAFDQKNIEHPSYSSIKYRRLVPGRIQVFLQTNDLENSTNFMNNIRNDFIIENKNNLNSGFSATDIFLDRHKGHDLKDILKVIDESRHTMDGLSERSKDERELLYDKNKFIGKLKEDGIKIKESEFLYDFVNYLIYYVSYIGVGELKVVILKENIISVKELIIIILFSLIFTLIIAYQKKY